MYFRYSISIPHQTENCFFIIPLLLLSTVSLALCWLKGGESVSDVDEMGWGRLVECLTHIREVIGLSLEAFLGNLRLSSEVSK